MPNTTSIAFSFRQPSWLPQLVALVLSLVATVAQAAPPPQSDSSDPTAKIAVWKQQLDVLDTEIKNTQPPTELFLSRVTDDLQRISTETTEFIVRNTPAAADAKTLLDKLGDAPKEGEPPEAEEVAKQRAELSARFKAFEGAIKTAGSLKERVGQLREQVVASRRDLFVTEIMRKGRSPFSRHLWQEAMPDLSDAGRRLSNHGAAWSRTNSLNQLLLILAAALSLFVVLQLAVHRFIIYYRGSPDAAKLPFFRLAASGAVVTLLRSLPTVVAAGACYAGLHIAEMLTPPFDQIVPIALFAVVAVIFIRALSMTLLEPKRPKWRILPVSSANALRVDRLLYAIAGVYGIDLFLAFLNSTLRMPLTLTVLQSAIAAVVFAGLLVGVLRTPFQTMPSGSQQTGGGLLRVLRLPLWFVVYAVLAATAFGYVSLARFLTQQTVVTVYVVIIVYLAFLAIAEFTDNFAEPDSRVGRILRLSFGMATQRREQVGAVAMLVLNGLLMAFTLPFLLLQWGFSWGDVSSWLQKLFFGFEFGGLNISLVSILIALGLFLGGLVLTKVFQSWLDQRILSKSRSQTGAEDSIKTAVGYAGIVASALVAVSYTGIGFSNIAIVAGALSVGIGFGLQSIVNNFVSGLILLVERPIKVGDLVIVGDDQGFVRRISVRATEIETFDKMQVVIPNSQLISERVKNWTLRGPLGRIMIGVGVSYDSDLQRVHNLLLEIANDYDGVLEYPAPFVLFNSFGESSVDFTLGVFVPDITSSLSVKTGLPIEIHRRFKEEGIEIPYRQTDLHIRDLDKVAEAMRGRRVTQPTMDATAGPPAAKQASEPTAGEAPPEGDA